MTKRYSTIACPIFFIPSERATAVPSVPFLHQHIQMHPSFETSLFKSIIQNKRYFSDASFSIVKYSVFAEVIRNKQSIQLCLKTTMSLTRNYYVHLSSKSFKKNKSLKNSCIMLHIFFYYATTLSPSSPFCNLLLYYLKQNQGLMKNGNILQRTITHIQ